MGVSTVSAAIHITPGGVPFLYTNAAISILSAVVIQTFFRHGILIRTFSLGMHLVCTNVPSGKRRAQKFKDSVEEEEALDDIFFDE